jgi:hypothetical protein
MLSVEKCKKYLGENYCTEDEIKEIRNSLYQAAELLIDKFVDDKKDNNRKIIEN